MKARKINSKHMRRNGSKNKVVGILISSQNVTEAQIYELLDDLDAPPLWSKLYSLGFHTKFFTKPRHLLKVLAALKSNKNIKIEEYWVAKELKV